ncbi:MAG TPA: hypothetical protein VK947_10185, partial [Planococcus sp. (in: firmicutes)]|nr:hypothetical protein [Planococcus sp. (in: firmicutes)]
MRKTLFSLLLLGLLVGLPFLLWNLHPKEPLEVAIINKTVPTESYREHQGLTWLLNHNHYTKREGQNYSESLDYFGFVVNEGDETYENRPIPESLGTTDLIYIADTYGVYKEDLPWVESADYEDAPPSLLYGGLSMTEWQTVKDQVMANGTDLVMEFNTFASPTAPDVRKDVTDFLGLDWTGWSGRHFEELDIQGDEIPPWIISRYEAQNGEWDFLGSGFVLVNDFEENIVVLSEEAGDIGSHGLRLAFTEAGQEQFSLEGSGPFGYWFDINLAADEHTLANYQWELGETGSQKLKEFGIPELFPAVVHQQKSRADVYYFAGDFVDIEGTPNFYRYSGLSKLRAFTSIDAFSPETGFYWKTYVPMMETILANASQKDTISPTARSESAQSNGVSYPARVNEHDFEVFQNGQWEAITTKGVNIGMAKPGTFPGEAGISFEEYERWFQAIGEMNANAIRIYTLHPPAFYQAFAQYNESAEEPLYLYHGVWIDEEPLVETLDAFTPEIVDSFQTEIKKIVDVVHGNAVVAQEPGHSYGTYTTDISPYVIGWMLGIEWYPEMVAQMDLDYADLGEFTGEHIYTENANPMEHWMAQQLELLANYELETYQSMRPLSFTNWVTTDNIDQPSEPSESEDMATVDPNHIKTKGELNTVGMFASYHVYPYYPEFLNLEEKYTEFTDHRGEQNNYAGYLKNLNETHDMPILIAEFGIPASRGLTHKNPFGWNQGFIAEDEQGRIISRLFEDILQEEMMGGLVFTWQDEWFKRTWNTMDYDNPDQRPFWSNAQTNEQQFGLLSFDRHKVKVNGIDDWEEGQLLYEKKDGSLKNVSMDHDERYVYVKAEFDPDHSIDWTKQDFNLYVSARDTKGVQVESSPGVKFPADFHLKIEDTENANLLIAGDYDTFYYDYYEKLNMIPTEGEDIHLNFHPIRLALNKEFVRPDTREVSPFEAYETGLFQFGMADPDHIDYHSLNDYFYLAETGVLEIRIPWMLLNAKDPSRLEFTGDIWAGGLEASIDVEGLEIAIN